MTGAISAFMASATPVKGRATATALPLPGKAIYQFPSPGYWAENVAVRQNGNLLITLLSPGPQLWQIARPYSDAPTAELVYTFPNLTSLLGIAETDADTFVLAGANFSAPGISAAWEVKFGDADAVTTRKVADLPTAAVLNGLATVPDCGGNNSSAVLIADSTRGLVFRVDLKTGAVEIAVQVSEMAPVANATSAVGINGVKIRDGYLYWDNSYAATIYRIKITPAGFSASDATVETVAKISTQSFLDDFAFDEDGGIWITSNHGRTVHRVDLKPGDSVIVAGAADETTLLGDTAAAFGRTATDSKVLYVTTSGFDSTNTPIEPGKIVAIDTTGWR